MTTEKLRIVQWATGTVGRAAMRAVLDHPHMELVGAKVYSAAKEGQDIGELCGRSRLGIPACQRRRKSRPLGGAKPGHLIRVLASAGRA